MLENPFVHACPCLSMFVLEAAVEPGSSGLLKARSLPCRLVLSHSPCALAPCQSDLQSSIAKLEEVWEGEARELRNQNTYIRRRCQVLFGFPGWHAEARVVADDPGLEPELTQSFAPASTKAHNHNADLLKHHKARTEGSQ